MSPTSACSAILPSALTIMGVNVGDSNDHEGVNVGDSNDHEG